MKSFLLIICLSICTGALAQGKPGPHGAGGAGRENLNALKLSKEQKKSIEALMKEEEQLHQLNMKKIDKILTPEQKKKLAEWIKRNKLPADSTSNSKNQKHD